MSSVYSERLSHFICGSCQGWFSIADVDTYPSSGGYSDNKYWCPHCGTISEFDLDIGRHIRNITDKRGNKN